MKQQPLVTVVINNYNYACYLTESINSALTQTYKNTEIIIVDDGSSDGSPEVIKRYDDPRIIPIFKENGGQASAFNAAYRASRGEIFCLLDADDVWLPTKVSAVVEAFQANSRASVVYHQVQNVNKQKQPLDRPWPHLVVCGDIAQKVVRMGGWWPFSPSTGLSFSRKFLQQVMEIPEEDYRICADTYLADLAPFFGEVIGIRQLLSLMRLHQNNNWSNSKQADQRAVMYHEIRIKNLNQKLQELEPKVNVKLQDNLPYCLTNHHLGKEQNILKLILMTLNNPYDWRPHSRLKSALNIWLENYGLRTL